jgi:hypothetical protein
MKWQSFACATIAAALVVGAPPAFAVFTSPTTSLVSVDSSGQQGADYSSHVAISANGRYIAFQSKVSTLVPGDGNNEADIFLRDTAAGTVTLVSVASDGTQANAGSFNPSISADGRYVAFESNGSNLVAGDTHGLRNVFVRDTVAGTTTLVSVTFGATPGPADADSRDPSISADGRLVAFSSGASDLVVGDNNNASDIFLRDTVSGTTQIVSVSLTGSGVPGNDGSFNPAISADGRHVAFDSDASDLVPNDTNLTDVFVRDMHTGATKLVSVASNGAQGNDFSYRPAISADGRYVAFSSAASNLVDGDENIARDIFVRDTAAGTTTLVSAASDGTQGNGESGSYEPSSISADGRYVAFESYASNLLAGDSNSASDVFVRDTVTKTTTAASVTTNGTFGSGDSFCGGISADARYVAYNTDAPNLVDTDANGSTSDVFLRGPLSSIAPAITMPVGVPIKSSPAAFEGSVAFGTDDGWLYIADVTGGTVSNVYPLNISDFVGTPVKIRSRPTVYYTSDAGPGWYFTTDRGDILAYTASGLGGFLAPLVGEGNTGTPAVTLDGQIYAGVQVGGQSGVVKLDPAAGGLVTAVALGGSDSTISSVAVAGNRVYVGMTNGAAGDIVVMNAADMTPLSSGIANGEGVTAPPYVVGGDMYVGTLAGNFYKLNSANGSVDTSFGPGGKVIVGEPLPTSPFFNNGAFYAGSSKGKVWKIGLNGSLSKAYDTWNPSAVVGGVVVERTSNTLAFGTSAGDFYKVPLSGGDAGVFGPTLGFETTPTYGASTGRFFIGSDDGNVYGF